MRKFVKDDLSNEGYVYGYCIKKSHDTIIWRENIKFKKKIFLIFIQHDIGGL